MSLIGIFFLAQRIANDPSFDPNRTKVATEDQGAAKARHVKDANLADRQSAGMSQSPTVPATQPETAGSPPMIVPASKFRPHPVRYLLAVPLAVLLIGSVVWVLKFRITTIVTDSEDFNLALDHWQPVLSQIFVTPRALKRFLNKVRYLAMLQRTEPPERTVGTTLIQWLRRRKDAEPEPVMTGLSQTALVGLAALDEAAGKPHIQGVTEYQVGHLQKFKDSLDRSQHDVYLKLTQDLRVS